MKKLLLFCFFLSITFASAQFNQDAPWMKTIDIESNRSSITFNEIVDAFNTYWETHDKDKRGSGYKPFMRWQTFWANFVKEDGTLPTAEELYSVWLEKRAHTSRSVLADESNWQPVGPFTHTNTGSWSSGQGRINAILVDPNNAANGTNIYYAGAPAGGVWKSTDGGSTWSVTTDDLPQIGVSGIAVEYGDADTIYIATGDDDAGDSFSVGVWKSTDGGLTWSTTGLNPSNSPSRMNDIYIHPSDPNTLWVATNNGVYKTTDAGVSWNNTLTGSNIRDIKLKPGDPNTIYAATSNKVYKSTNAGNSFSLSSMGLPGSSGRLVIDVTPDNPDVLYVLSATTGNGFQGLYKSSNSGASFSLIGNISTLGDIFESDQAWYDMAMAVSDTDENIVFTGVLNIWRIDVNGSNPTATKINNWNQPSSASYSHADIHLLRFYNGELFAGTDGGFYKSANYGANFTDLTAGMQISQFYRISVSKQTSSNMVGGLQDNGGYAINGTTNQWQNYYGADGMDTAIDPLNPNLYYGFTQKGGSLNISSNGGANFTNQIGGASTGNWITPLVMNSDGELYAGYSNLYRFTGSGWTSISPSFGTNINVLEIDNINPDNIYVAINNSLRKSTNRGVSFTTAENFSTNITSIEVNNNDSNIVYVTTSGSNGKVFRSSDGGLSFTNITGSFPNVTKNVIKHQEDNIQNPLYVGTSLGVYRYDDSTAEWEAFENNLPNVAVTDLEINIVDENITAATYGRGVWQSDLAPTALANDDLRLVSVEGINPNTIECGDILPQLILKNNGLNTITSIDVSYTIDNGTPQIFTWTGTLLSEEEVTIDIPTLTLAQGEHQFFTSTAIPNDQFPGNNDSSVITFNVNGSGVAQQVNTFETVAEELIAYDEASSTVLWERGIPTGTLLNTATSGTQVYGTNLDGDHPDQTKGYLVSQCYDLSILTGPMLKFDMAFEIEQNWDLAYMEYSTDNGVNWSLLGTANDPNWYNSSRIAGDGIDNNCYNCVGGQWTGTDTTMKEYSYNLSALNTETSIMFRFVYHSDQSVVEEGVIIDDFVIDGTLSTKDFSDSQFSIYPNPSKGIFNLKISNTFENMNLSVVDVTGKVVKHITDIQNNQTNYKLDMNGFASGIYFLKIRTSLGEATKKLLLN